MIDLNATTCANCGAALQGSSRGTCNGLCFTEWSQKGRPGPVRSLRSGRKEARETRNYDGSTFYSVSTWPDPNDGTTPPHMEFVASWAKAEARLKTSHTS